MEKKVKIFMTVKILTLVCLLFLFRDLKAYQCSEECSKYEIGGNECSPMSKGHIHKEHTQEKEKIEQKRNQLHKKRLDRLEKELGLNEEQKQKLSQIMDEGWEKIKTEMGKMKKLTKEIKEQTNNQIEKILTSEQIEKYKKFKEEMKNKVKEKFLKENK